MQVTIYIPKKYEADYRAAQRSAKQATETGGIGAYFIELHQREMKRKDNGR